MNVQAGIKDRDRDYLSNQGRCPTVSTGSRSSQRIHPNLLVVFFFISFCCFSPSGAWCVCFFRVASVSSGGVIWCELGVFLL